jgi:hypothetical protein
MNNLTAIQNEKKQFDITQRESQEQIQEKDEKIKVVEQ